MNKKRKWDFIDFKSGSWVRFGGPLCSTKMELDEEHVPYNYITNWVFQKR